MKGIIILCMVTLFCSCTFKNSKPYSAKKTASILSKFYQTEIEVIKEVTVKEAPCAENRYIMRDKIFGFEFVAGVSIEDSHFPFWPAFVQHINDNYQTAIMCHFGESAKKLANNYGIRLVPVDNIRQQPLDRIYIEEPEQLVEVSKLYFQLKALYHFDKEWKYDLHPMLTYPQFYVSYLEQDNPNIDQANLIHSFDYVIYGDPKKFINEDYQNTETMLNSLSAWWNEAYRQGKVIVPTPDRDFNKIREKIKKENAE